MSSKPGRDKPAPIRICRHCSKCKVNRPRGLCWSCYHRPGVREQYPPLGPRGEAGAKGHREDAEPTMKELEAMIAEQMRCLPAWWAKANEEQDRRDNAA